ncbi:MAG: glutamine synthetase family protein [Proteobacteria bacterium]|nr:glutamine synthetase family protein [Pseudomonadota bacterium]
MEQLRAAFNDRGIRRVKLGGFDLDGVLRGKYIHVDKFWSAVDKGLGFCDVIFGWDVGDQLYDNASITGWHTGYPDLQARVDASSFRVLPEEPETAVVLVDFYGPDGSPHPACPRNLLKRVVARLSAAGFQAKVGVEYEFWLFRESAESAHAKRYQDLAPLSPGMFGYSWVRQGQHADLLEHMIDSLAAFGIELEGLHTETGPGVYEAALRAQHPLAAADAAALFKSVLKVLAARSGCLVSFMAKWRSDLPGSSGHIHESLWTQDESQNLFADPKTPDGLSQTARRFAAGLVSLMPELTALYSPTVNSYKRYVPGVWAPTTASWGIENRTCAVRAITGPGKAAARLEYRQTAADVNPYIGIATSLAAGLHGLEQGLEAPPPIEGDATVSGVAPPLPASLAAANQALACSTAARTLLGDAFVDHFVRTRDWELRQYARSVTDWELARYFEAI